jgi:hypothetical protein
MDWGKVMELWRNFTDKKKPELLEVKYVPVPLCLPHPTWTGLWSNPGLLVEFPVLTIWAMPLLLYFNAQASQMVPVHHYFFQPDSFLQCCLPDMLATCSTALVSLIFHHPDNSLWLMCWTPEAFVAFCSTGSVYDKGFFGRLPSSHGSGRHFDTVHLRC